MQVKFRRQPLTLTLGYYENGKAHPLGSIDTHGYVLGNDPVVGYCPTSDGDAEKEKLPWTVVHIKTGATVLCCKSERRARAIVKAIEEKHRAIFSFTKAPTAKQLKPHRDTVKYLKTIAQGEWKE